MTVLWHDCLLLALIVIVFGIFVKRVSSVPGARRHPRLILLVWSGLIWWLGGGIGHSSGRLIWVGQLSRILLVLVLMR